jgi:hypothetical protein
LAFLVFAQIKVILIIVNFIFTKSKAGTKTLLTWDKQQQAIWRESQATKERRHCFIVEYLDVFGGLLATNGHCIIYKY